MKVVLVVHQFFPAFSLGTERYALSLAKGLMELGDEVVVLTADVHRESAEASEPIREYEWDGVRVFAVSQDDSPIRRHSDYHSRPDRSDLYEDVLRKERPDIVHCCHLLHLGLEIVHICRCLGVPVTATLTDLWGLCWAGQMIKPCDGSLCAGPDSDSTNCVQDFLLTKRKHGGFSTAAEGFLARVPIRPLQYGLLKLLKRLPEKVKMRWLPDTCDIGSRNQQIKETFSHFAEVVFPSRYLQEQCWDYGLIERGKGVLLPYGLRPPGPEEREKLRADKAGQERVVGYIGQIATHKGVDLLLKAFQNVRDEHLRLHIYGKPNPGDPCGKELIEHMKQDPRIEYMGSFNKNEVYEVLSGVDALILPSVWHENAPISMLEALMAGVPVLASRARGVVDFIEEGRTGLLFEMRSVAAIEEVLQQFLKEGSALRKSCLERPGFCLTQLDHAKTLRERMAVHRRTGNWKPPKQHSSISKFLRVSAGPPSRMGNPDVMTGTLLRGGARRCQFRIPIASNPDEPPMEEKIPDCPKNPKRRGASSMGATFPRFWNKECLIRTHSRNYLSVWGDGACTIHLLKTPGSQEAVEWFFCARPKNGLRSRLTVSGTLKENMEEITLVHEWNWNPKAWTTLSLNLRELREHFHTVDQIKWHPVLTRSRWKIDFTEYAFTPAHGTHGMQASASQEQGRDRSRTNGHPDIPIL